MLTGLTIVAIFILVTFWVAVMLHNGKLTRELQREREINRAVHWMCQWNNNYKAAAQDALMTGCNISHKEAWKRIERRVTANWWRGLVQQTIPLDLVPEELKRGAQEYNARITFGQLPQYSSRVEETEKDVRIRQLQDAVLTMGWNLSETASNSELINTLARMAGVSYHQAEAVMQAYAGRKQAAADNILNVFDPEEVLPSIY